MTPAEERERHQIVFDTILGLQQVDLDHIQDCLLCLQRVRFLAALANGHRPMAISRARKIVSHIARTFFRLDQSTYHQEFYALAAGSTDIEVEFAEELRKEYPTLS